MKYTVIWFSRTDSGIFGYQEWNLYRDAKKYADVMRENALTCWICHGTIIVYGLAPLLGPFPCEPFHIRVFPWLRPAFVFCVGCLLPTGLLPNVDPHR